MSIFENLKIPAESLYNKKCTVYEYITIRDEITGIDSTKEYEKYNDVPCRISYKSIPNTSQTDTGASLTQSICLFCSPDYDIQPGSKVSCQGKAYKASGEPAVYTSHQEIELILDKEWA